MVRAAPYQADAKRRRRYERSEPRIARRKPQKKPHEVRLFLCAQRLAQKHIYMVLKRYVVAIIEGRRRRRLLEGVVIEIGIDFIGQVAVEA